MIDHLLNATRTHFYESTASGKSSSMKRERPPPSTPNSGTLEMGRKSATLAHKTHLNVTIPTADERKAETNKNPDIFASHYIGHKARKNELNRSSSLSAVYENAAGAYDFERRLQNLEEQQFKQIKYVLFRLTFLMRKLNLNFKLSQKLEAIKMNRFVISNLNFFIFYARHRLNLHLI